jgi:hypothetical protein
MMKSLFFFAVVTTLAGGCSFNSTSPVPEGRGEAALGSGTCQGSCGTLSKGGGCWCDDLCATFGDCCADVEDICELDECRLEESGVSVGCADGQSCVPGVCAAECQGQEDDCCAPASCEIDIVVIVVADCASDSQRATVTEDTDGLLTLTIVDADGDLLDEGPAEYRVIEDGPRITRIGYQSANADLRIRTRDTLIPATEGAANLRFDHGNHLLQCDVY